MRKHYNYFQIFFQRRPVNAGLNFFLFYAETVLGQKDTGQKDTGHKDTGHKDTGQKVTVLE